MWRPLFAQPTVRPEIVPRHWAQQAEDFSFVDRKRDIVLWAADVLRLCHKLEIA